jgi:hypothetical protein
MAEYIQFVTDCMGLINSRRYTAACPSLGIANWLQNLKIQRVFNLNWVSANRQRCRHIKDSLKSSNTCVCVSHPSHIFTHGVLQTQGGGKHTGTYTNAKTSGVQLQGLGVMEILWKIWNTIYISTCFTDGRTLKIRHKRLYTFSFWWKLCSREEILPIKSN